MKKSRLRERDVRHNNGSFFVNASEDAKHDEIAERSLMKKKMDARKRAAALLENRRLLEELYRQV